tara:strand:- start:480 stop:656 length:177 start_codon:yes stop_codon:yes gene_type:complete
MKTQLMFRQTNGKLGKVSFDDSAKNIQAVQYQSQIKQDVLNLGRKLKPKTPVLCLIIC